MHLFLRSYLLFSMIPLTSTFAAANPLINQPASSAQKLNMTSQAETVDPINTQTAADIVEIRQAINLFAIAVDQHKLDLLSQVFTNDVAVNFSLPSGEILYGLSAVTQLLATLQAVPSQHDQSTFYHTRIGSQEAHTTTYNTATFFGSGDLKGQVFTNYGR